MTWLNANPYRRVFAFLLVVLLFGGKTFSCCLVNKRLGDFMKASLASIMPEAAATNSNACCSSKRTPAGSPCQKQGTGSGGCCIQDANTKVPQEASAGSRQPAFAAIVVERLPRVETTRPASKSGPAFHPSICDSPLYLANLQLLI